MSETIEKAACTVRDGRFVEPCDALASVDESEGPFSKKRGIHRWDLVNATLRKPSRTFYGIKTKGHPEGVAFNFCPFCGEKIDAPFCDEEAAA